MLSPCHSTVLAAALLGLGGLVSPQIALACGGAFCSGGTFTPPVPVEQNSERILFEVNPDDTVSTTVEISYTGAPESFAWVVPVPDTPGLDIVPAEVLALLDDGTAPSLNSQPTRCGSRRIGCSSVGTSFASLALPVVAAPTAILGCSDMALLSSPSAYDPVTVEVIDRVGPYEPTVVSSDDPQALIDWLNTEGYFISEGMEPYVAHYVSGGSKFLAMKLAPDVGVSDIAPIRMTYAGDTPQIPLVLTAVAAEPEMAITAFIAGPSRYRAGNYANLLMDPAWLRFDPSGVGSNYYAVASWLADGVGGRAFFTEYSGPVTFASFGLFEAEDWVRALGQRHPTITRLYTRLSGWEMTEDPYFEPTEAGPIVAAIDLSANEPVDTCQDRVLGPCGATYCGPGAMCADTLSGPACVCPEGWAAREVSAVGAARGAGIPDVTCQLMDHELFTSDELGGDAGSACVPGMCGTEGECLDLNGFPTCLCDDGFAAAVGFNGAPTCVEALQLYSPEEALVGGDKGVGFAAHEASPSRRRTEVLVGLLIVMLPGLLGSRRRRRER